MRRTEVYQVRLDVHEKKQAFAVFKQLGITPAQAVRLFFRQVVITRSIPFPIEHLDAEIKEPAKKSGKKAAPVISQPEASIQPEDAIALDHLSDQDVFDQLNALLKDNSSM